MTDAVGKEILIEGADPRELYGPRNVYLDQMKSLHPQLRIVARGSSLKVLGALRAASLRRRLRWTRT